MSIAVASSSLRPVLGPERIRVMVVDDSIVVRGLFARWIESEPQLQFVGAARSGREALEQIGRAEPDVLVLDLDMPDVDGMTALPLLLAKKRDLVVIMASTLTVRNADISLRALALGAADYVAKPRSHQDLGVSSFRRNLIDRIKALGTARMHKRARSSIAAASRFERGTPLPPSGACPPLAPREPEAIRLRPFPPVTPRVLVLGASTGGPQALHRVLTSLAGLVDQVPVLLVQHMPATFTTVLAEHLQRAIGRPVYEGVDGEPVLPGRVYVARGGCHMRVKRQGGQPVIALDQGAPVHFCRPAVDLLFESAAQVWGAKAFGVVLTGMGCDGTAGAAALVDAGASIMAQDESSSVVWGMPGSVAHAGLCCAVLPLEEIAPCLMRLFSGEHP